MAAGQLSELEKEAAQRLKDCQRQKAFVQTDLQEAYFFTAPQRARDMTSSTGHSDGPSTDAATLATSIGIEVSQDFATEMVNTFMPSVIAWASQKAAVEIPEEEVEAAQERIEANTSKVMDAIKTSNLYDAVAVGFKPDLALGTVAMWIGDGHLPGTIECRPVPLRELEINIGPDGGIDDRFIVRSTRNRFVRKLIGKTAWEKAPPEVKSAVESKPNGRTKVSWGWWRLWNRDDDVVWKFVTRIGDKIVEDGELKGEGSCPCIVSRFNVDPMLPFGAGPTVQCLPELRELDETRILKAENRDFQIHPAFVYQDDGVMNFSNGIEPGMGYVARAWGNGKPVEKLSFEGNLEVAEYEIAQMEHRIRRLHFVDYPEQIGKTPPTAEQWAEELMRAKRRIGTPGRVFWKEGPAEYFRRFKWILEKRGVLEPLTAGGKALPLVPYDPTEQAQEHQEVAVAGRILEMGRNYMPDVLPVLIDGAKTLENIKAKLRDKIVEVRDEAAIGQAVQQLSGLLGGAGGGPVPGAPPV